jgi:hypothetical protein
MLFTLCYTAKKRRARCLGSSHYLWGGGGGGWEMGKTEGLKTFLTPPLPDLQTFCASPLIKVETFLTPPQCGLKN